MNIIWAIFIIFSLFSLILFNPIDSVSLMTNSIFEVLKLCTDLLAIYTLWLGVLEILDKTGIADKIANLFKPILKKLFKTQNQVALKLISVNLTANMLGLGNASTPAGIMAMKKLDKCNGKITKQMILLFVLNISSIQLFPTTIISLRAKFGSQFPSDIILPTIISSSILFFLSIFLAKFCEKLFFKKTDKG